MSQTPYEQYEEMSELAQIPNENIATILYLIFENLHELKKLLEEKQNE
jgi:hypothetical protein